MTLAIAVTVGDTLSSIVLACESGRGRAVHLAKVQWTFARRERPNREVIGEVRGRFKFWVVITHTLSMVGLDPTTQTNSQS